MRQGWPLSPFLFVLAVEILALKLRHDPDCKGIILLNSREAKLMQFGNDTTVISSSVASLKSLYAYKPHSQISRTPSLET